METDWIRFVQKYHQCQFHGDLIHAPLNQLNMTSSPWPFKAWGMDVIDPIEPSTSNGYWFIFVAIDYFTKWVEAPSYKFVTKKVMNEAAEAANKNIKWILLKMIDNYKHWHENLPFSLLGYCTTIRTSIGATPYLLVYGIETVLPIKVDILSLRIIQKAELSDAK
ncbi:uncharacterized protein LOC107846563 [Capsicum annuum]|uniref:uncharacterized protein LOC107846563 n=1 Tax=Capsicum annuum TaxID=4072 RepID=UPI001FB1929D|nr:uncharacterized protein LOC107846563 [Capsicum annuum]